MKPAPFDYCRPTTVAEAVEALKADESGRVLAGGQSLIPAMNFRLTDVSLLVDIRRVEGLDRVASDAGGATVGAAATQSRVLGDDDAATAVPGLRAALRHVGHLQIRNRGTVCGSLAHADPGDFAVAGLVAVLEAEAGAVRTARLVGFGVGGVPTPLVAAEAAVQGWTAGTPTDGIVEAVLADTGDAFDDIHATGWYRSEAVAALVVRAARSATTSKEAA